MLVNVRARIEEEENKSERIANMKLAAHYRKW